MQVEASWGVPDAPPTPFVEDGPDGYRQLALQGAWRVLLERTTGAAETTEDVVVAAWRVLALFKLRMYSNAADELALLEPLHAEDFFTNCPAAKPWKLPFALHWIWAELPEKMGRAEDTLDRLYTLLDMCTTQLVAPAAALSHPGQTEGDGSGVGVAVSEGVWRRRHETIMFAIVNCHVRAREYVAALRWLAVVAEARPEDGALASRVGYVQLAMGDLRAAGSTLRRASALLAAAGASAQAALARRNRALLLFAEQDYAGAQAEFDAVLQASGDDCVAANNKAISLMYACNLANAVEALEGALRVRPLAHLREAVLRNLCSMYELRSATAAAEAKRALGAWARVAAPDDFDLPATRAA